MKIGGGYGVQGVQVAFVPQIKVVLRDFDLAMPLQQGVIAVLDDLQLVPIRLITGPPPFRRRHPGAGIQTHALQPLAHLVRFRRHGVQRAHLSVYDAPARLPGRRHNGYAGIGADAMPVFESLEQPRPVLARDDIAQPPHLPEIILVFLQGLAELPVQRPQLVPVQPHLGQLAFEVPQLLLVGADLLRHHPRIHRRDAGGLRARAYEETDCQRAKPLFHRCFPPPPAPPWSF